MAPDEDGPPGHRSPHGACTSADRSPRDSVSQCFPLSSGYYTPAGVSGDADVTQPISTACSFRSPRRMTPAHLEQHGRHLVVPGHPVQHSQYAVVGSRRVRVEVMQQRAVRLQNLWRHEPA